MLRPVVAAGLALFLVFAAGAPHVHEGHGPHGADHCMVCAARGAALPGEAGPDLTPAPTPEAEAPLAPRLAPVTGAPLGAVPGQSPPRSA